MTAPSDDGTPTRFEPPVGAESGPFWDATREGRLLVQWCTACDRGVFYPRSFCPHCAAPGSALEWRVASGRATVHAAVVEHRPEAARVTFSGGAPYCVALVDLEEGVRMMTNVIGCPPDGGPLRHGGHRDVGAPQRRASAAPVPTRPGHGPLSTMHGTVSVPEDKLAAAAQGMLHAWWAERIPDRLALVTHHGDRTYADLNADINRLARALRARGLQAGDSIALMCTNRPEFLEVLYAAQRIGLRFTPINWHLTGAEAAYIVENCEAKAFVCSGDLGDKVTVAAEAGGSGLVKINSGGYVPGFEMYHSVVAAEDGSNIDDPVLGTQMLYTSGTTGRPKGVHRDTTVVSALATVNFCGYDEDYSQSVDAHLVTGPLYHAAPLAFSVAVPFLYGVPLVVMDHWDAVEWLRLVERHGITHTHMVPTMFHRLLALPPEERERASTRRRCAS